MPRKKKHELPFYEQSPRNTQPQYGNVLSGATNPWAAGAAGSREQYGDSRGQQQEAMGMYRDMAQGRGPSMAQEQLKQQTQQNTAGQMSMAAQARGGNLAGQQQQAAGAGVGAQMGAQQQAGQIRAQEQMGAMGGLAGMAQQQAGQDNAREMQYNQMLAQAYNAQLGADTEWGLGQRGLDIEQQSENRGFGTRLGLGIGNLIARMRGK